MRVLFAIQSRLGSKRFPRKSFADICGKPLICRTAERIQKIKHPSVIICPQNETAEYKSFLQKHNTDIEVFGGSEDNVLERFYKAALHYGSPDIIVRVTGDNPLISPVLAEELLEAYEGGDLSHHIGNTLGTGVELIKFSALEYSYRYADADYQKEHVTQYIYQNPDLFDIREIESPYIFDYEGNLSVDLESDIKKIENLLKDNPDWDISLYPK